MMQGDSYGLRIDILKADGTAVTADDVADQFRAIEDYPDITGG